MKPKVVEARSYSPFKGGKASAPSPAVAAVAVTKTVSAPVSVPASPRVAPLVAPALAVKEFVMKAYTWSPHSVTLIDG